jgi:outer membrane protein assembly factor BamB
VTGAALDRATGKIVWSSGGGPTGYATPVKTTIGGRTVLAIFSGKELVGVDPQTGRKLWAFPWQTSYDVNAADQSSLAIASLLHPTTARAAQWSA